MFGVRYAKFAPTTYVLHYIRGKVIREGPGLSFWHFAPNSTISAVPVSSMDVPFIFNDVSADFQSVTLQGQLTYRVSDPRKLASLLDYSVTGSGRYQSNDPGKLQERLVAQTQVFTSAITHRLTLREALVAHAMICREVVTSLRASDLILMLGIEILSLSVLNISPTPEVGKALEAEAREDLQRRSDEAVYARRNAAVEQERRIRENEMNTEIMVEEKRRAKRETQMAAEIAVENQRVTLLEQRVQNERKQADSKAYALEATLKPVRELDWRMVLAMNAANLDPKQTIAMAFRDLAENAQKIGTLNITPDLLETLIESEEKKKK